MPRVLRPPYNDPAVQRFNDQLRDNGNFQRVVVRERIPSQEPQEGELIRSGDTLLVSLRGSYKQIYPPLAEEAFGEVPEFIRAQWSLLQEELELIQAPLEEWAYYTRF